MGEGGTLANPNEVLSERITMATYVFHKQDGGERILIHWRRVIKVEDNPIRGTDILLNNGDCETVMESLGQIEGFLGKEVRNP